MERFDQHFRPHRLCLALLATRLSREFVDSLNGKVILAGEFINVPSEVNRAAEV